MTEIHIFEDNDGKYYFCDDSLLYSDTRQTPGSRTPEEAAMEIVFRVKEGLIPEPCVIRYRGLGSIWNPAIDALVPVTEYAKLLNVSVTVED